MSQNTPTTENQEIDLGSLFKKIEQFFINLIAKAFSFLNFIKRNSIKLIALVVVGFVIGFVLDTYSKKYSTETIVTYNHISPDYLYSKIDLIKTKIFAQDSTFFKQIGLTNYKSISYIEIEPIIDIYSFINSNTALANNAQNTQNFEMIKLLSETSDIEKVLKDKVTSKNYPFQTIKILSKEKLNSNQIKAIFNYLNADDYYKKILNTNLENIKQETLNNEGVIKQIDTLIKNMSNNIKTQKAATIQVGGDKNQIAELITQKRELTQTNLYNKLRLINQSYIVKDLSTVANTTYTKGINDKLKLIFPFLLVVGFFAFHFFRYFKTKYNV